MKQISISNWRTRKERIFKSNLLDLEYILKRTCTIDVLVVTDFGGSYGSASFGLSSFLKAFEDPLKYTSFKITKAHRRTDSEADIENFRFDSTDLKKYDVIFLFGVERPAFRPQNSAAVVVDDNELKALSEYMDAGHGVFATGDHEDLGVDMCGRIPRIRSMRRWYTAANPGPNNEPNAPAQSGGNEHNTIVSGTQSDFIPQNIKIDYRYGFAGLGGFSIYRYVKYPHPVLCSPDGVINVLPDHMHEGLCEIPNDLSKSFNFNGYSIEEYPFVGSSRLKPEVIAEGINHVTSSDFGLISVLDGHKDSSIGRVLVDATWHHFFNINIGQFQALKELVDNGSHVPNATEQKALEKYNLIQHYYRNIAYWLAPKAKQRCFKRRGWIYLLRHHDIIMSIRKIDDIKRFDRFKYFHTVGTLAKNALGDIQSECQSSALLIFHELLAPIRSKFDFNDASRFSFINPELYETMSFGFTLHRLKEYVDQNKGDIVDEKLDAIVEEAQLESLEELFDHVGKSTSTLRKRLNRFRKNQPKQKR